MTDAAQAPKASTERTLTAEAGKYVLDEELGRGGNGSVFLGYLEKAGLQNPVAIKVLHGALALTEDACRRLVDEARIAIQFKHPNLVAVTDIGLFGNAPFIVMERVDGVNLRAFLDAIPEPLEVDICNFVVGEVAAGLACLHDRTIGDHDAGVVHSDVTPRNIMISSTGEVKLTDFGIARFAHVERTRTQPIGTPSYMSPEQRMGKTPRGTDAFSLGIIMHELLNGGIRYHADKSEQQFVYAILNGHVPPFTRPGIDEWSATLCRRMLSPRVDARPPARVIREIILAKSPHYMLAQRKIEDLYKRHIGPKRTGWTKLLNTADFFRQVPPESSPIELSLDSSFDAPSALPDERTVADAGERDAPSVFRRHRTPPAEALSADPTRATARTGTVSPEMIERMSSAREQPVGGEPSLLEPVDAPPPLLIHESAPTPEPPSPLPDAVDEPWSEYASNVALGDLSQEIESTIVLDPLFPEPSESEPSAVPIEQPATSSQPVSASLPAASVADGRGRTFALWVLAGLVGLLVIVLVVLLAVLVSSERRSDVAATTPSPTVPPQTTEPVRTEREPEPAIKREPEIEHEPKIEPVPETEPVEAAELVPPEPDPKPTETDDGDSSDENASGESKQNPEPDPPKPKKPPIKKAKVLFFAPHSQVALEVGKSKFTGSSVIQKSLPLGTHRVRWRALPDGPWNEVGEFDVTEPPEGKAHQVTLSTTGMKLGYATVGKGK